VPSYFILLLHVLLLKSCADAFPDSICLLTSSFSCSFFSFSSPFFTYLLSRHRPFSYYRRLSDTLFQLPVSVSVMYLCIFVYLCISVSVCVCAGEGDRGVSEGQQLPSGLPETFRCYSPWSSANARPSGEQYNTLIEHSLKIVTEESSSYWKDGILF
jgi:hypothetical protein